MALGRVSHREMCFVEGHYRHQRIECLLRKCLLEISETARALEQNHLLASQHRPRMESQLGWQVFKCGFVYIRNSATPGWPLLTRKCKNKIQLEHGASSDTAQQGLLASQGPTAMIGTLEAGLQPCPQPISMPVTPGSDAHQRKSYSGSRGRIGQVTTAKRGRAWASAQGDSGGKGKAVQPSKVQVGRRPGLSRETRTSGRSLGT